MGISQIVQRSESESWKWMGGFSDIHWIVQFPFSLINPTQFLLPTATRSIYLSVVRMKWNDRFIFWSSWMGRDEWVSVALLNQSFRFTHGESVAETNTAQVIALMIGAVAFDRLIRKPKESWELSIVLFWDISICADQLTGNRFGVSCALTSLLVVASTEFVNRLCRWQETGINIQMCQTPIRQSIATQLNKRCSRA